MLKGISADSPEINSRLLPNITSELLTLFLSK